MAETIEILRSKVQDILPQIEDALLTQAQVALQELAKVSGYASALGLGCLRGISEAGLLMAQGKLTKESAALAVKNYLTGLRFAGESVTEKALTEAYDRGQAFLKNLG